MHRHPSIGAAPGVVAAAFASPKAGYATLAASLWLALSVLRQSLGGRPDGTGPVAVAGVVAIYIASAEMTALFAALAALSVVAATVGTGVAAGVAAGAAKPGFFGAAAFLLELAAQAAAAVLAYAVWREASAELTAAALGIGASGVSGGMGAGAAPPVFAPPPPPPPPPPAAPPAPRPPAYGGPAAPPSNGPGAYAPPTAGAAAAPAAPAVVAAAPAPPPPPPPPPPSGLL
jgi:hypothetical protein